MKQRIAAPHGFVDPVRISYITRQNLDPWREWLRTYRVQGRGTHYLSDPGSQDITAQVMLDQLPSGSITSTQADFLQQWGIDELVREGTTYWENMKHARDIAALKMRSRNVEHLDLTSGTMLGSHFLIEFN